MDGSVRLREIISLSKSWSLTIFQSSQTNQRKMKLGVETTKSKVLWILFWSTLQKGLSGKKQKGRSTLGVIGGPEMDPSLARPLFVWGGEWRQWPGSLPLSDFTGETPPTPHEGNSAESAWCCIKSVDGGQIWLQILVLFFWLWS